MKMPIEMITELTEKSLPFVRNIGIKALVLEPGFVKLFLPYQGNENHVKTVYAGALFTLAEMPGGAIFMTSFDVEKYYPIVKDMYIRFRRPAHSDVTVEVSLSGEEIARIQTEADTSGKADYILESELKSDTGEVVAIAKGTYQMRRHGI